MSRGLPLASDQLFAIDRSDFQTDEAVRAEVQTDEAGNVIRVDFYEYGGTADDFDDRFVLLARKHGRFGLDGRSGWILNGSNSADYWTIRTARDVQEVIAIAGGCKSLREFAECLGEPDEVIDQRAELLHELAGQAVLNYLTGKRAGEVSEGIQS